MQESVIRLSGGEILSLPFTTKKINNSGMVQAIVRQFEYWFSKKADKFYKFVEPCDNFKYKQGDSWVEEMNCSRHVFTTCFDLIGVRYKSKTEFEAQADPFKGKLYASYFDRQSRVVYYVRNHEFFKKHIQKIRTVVKSRLSKSKSSSDFICSDSRSQNAKVLSSPNKETIITKHNPLSPPKPANAAPGDEVILKLIKIWQECTADKTTTTDLRARQKQQLLKAFKETCQENLEVWKNFCRMIAGNKFLNGKISSIGWKISLSWLLRAKNWTKIMQGKYGLTINKIYHIEKSSELVIDEIINGQNNKGIASEILQDYKIILKDLAKNIDTNSLASWFNKVDYLGKTGTTAIFQAPNQFIAANIENRFEIELLNACKTLGVTKIAVQIATSISG